MNARSEKIDHRNAVNLRHAVDMMNDRDWTFTGSHNVTYICDAIQSYHGLSDLELERYIEHVFRRRK